MEKVKQIIVLRKDLNMRKGKMVAQGSHASLAALLNLMDKSNPDIYTLNLKSHPAVKTWLNVKFTKICVSVDSEAELLEIHGKAVTAGLPTALIKDAGDTEFKGVPTLTCCAVGPALVEEVDKITANLSLL